MSRDARVELTWGGDLRTFRLGIAEIFALEDALDQGIAQLAAKISAGMWRVRDLQETIRFGLIGAGVDGRRAKELVSQHVVSGDLVSSVLIAQAILLDALSGDMRDPVGKEEAAADTTETETTVFQPPPSTGVVQ